MSEKRWLSRCDEGSYNYIIPEDYREREPECSVCGMRKGPLGRSVGDAMANSRCGFDCEGYLQDPQPSSFHVGEFGQFDVNLFLAGPELLAALKRAIPHVEDNLADDQGFLSARKEAYVASLREAIIKAEGGP